MNEGIVTRRYAKALFQAGEEEGKTDNIRKDIEMLLATIADSEEFKGFLQSPIIKESMKLNLFAKIFTGKINPITLTFLQLMAKNKRERFLASACLQYLSFYKESQGVKQASITTSRALTDNHKKEVLNYIKRKFKIDVDLVENIDESIIGGFKLRIEDIQLDASIQSKLKRIETELINS